MACGCNRRPNTEFVWTSADGQTTVVYTTEIQAKAKVIRKGGTYEPRQKVA